MRPAENIEKRIQNVPIQTSAKRDKEVLDDVLDTLEKSKKTQPAAAGQNIWRIIMQSKKVKLTVAAIIFIVIMLGIHYLNTPLDGASTAFAAAMDSIKQARTFSCIQIFEMTYEDNGKEGKYLSKEKIMFKEPDRERRVQLTSPWPRFVGEITITDFSKRRELTIRPAEKTATLSEKNYSYEVDPNTGKLKLRQLDTSLRDRLLKLSEEAVKDLGTADLAGQQVRKFQTQKGSRVTTVWINPENNLPVQIEQKWTDQSRSPFMYVSIQIDTELDDSLFSLEPPEGYAFKVVHPGWSDDQIRLSAKMGFLLIKCAMFAQNHNNHHPAELAELGEVGVTKDMLKIILSASDEPNEPAVIQYRAIPPESDWIKEVVLYEVYNQWPDSGVVVGFADGHREIIHDQNRFKELIK
jgi:outer membrane lipoprotein-sorting protein